LSAKQITTTYVTANGKVVAKQRNDTDKVSYYHGDHLGSTSLITNEEGEVESKEEYKPFGSKFSSSGLFDRFKFTGKEFDEDLQQYYFLARNYLSDAGRFNAIDPILDPTRSPYVYANNNPFKYVDPSGMTIYLLTYNPDKMISDPEDPTGKSKIPDPEDEGTQSFKLDEIDPNDPTIPKEIKKLRNLIQEVRGKPQGKFLVDKLNENENLRLYIGYQELEEKDIKIEKLENTIFPTGDQGTFGIFTGYHFNEWVAFEIIGNEIELREYTGEYFLKDASIYVDPGKLNERLEYNVNDAMTLVHELTHAYHASQMPIDWIGQRNTFNKREKYAENWQRFFILQNSPGLITNIPFSKVYWEWYEENYQ